MTTYNGVPFLAEQLKSLALQTRLPLELVVGDDGSTDGTLEVLQRFADTAPFPVRVHSNESRLGFATNFLTTARRASGEILAFCDQDDVWHSSKVQIVEDAMSSDEILLCTHKAWLIDENGKNYGRFNNGIGKPRILEPFQKRYWPLYYGFTLTTRRHVVISIAEFLEQGDGSLRKTSHSHDGWVSFVAANCGKIVELGDFLVEYRQHRSNSFGLRQEREKFSTATELKNNARYLEITRDMIDYLSFRFKHLEYPGCHNMSRAFEVYEGIYRHIESKNDCQSASNLPQAYLKLFRHVALGDYRDPYDGRFRFRSFVHDLLFVPRRFIVEPICQKQSL